MSDIFISYAREDRERVAPIAKILEALDLLVVQPDWPDLTLIIDIPADVGLARAALRQSQKAVESAPGHSPGERHVRSLAADRYEARGIDYHRRLREGFLKIAEVAPKRCVVLDGQLSADAVARAVLDAVERRLLAKAI